MERRKQTFLEALDFSEVRSYEDAKLLSDAKYGVRAKDGKMTREQYKCDPYSLTRPYTGFSIDSCCQISYTGRLFGLSALRTLH